MKGRARRRMDQARMKRKAIKIYHDGYGVPQSKARKYANHLHPCSCAMGCGNRRLFDGPPMQERRALTVQDVD